MCELERARELVEELITLIKLLREKPEYVEIDGQTLVVERDKCEGFNVEKLSKPATAETFDEYLDNIDISRELEMLQFPGTDEEKAIAEYKSERIRQLMEEYDERT